jgi:hypothetical protein
MKTSLCITLILTTFLLNAQDTIYFKDKKVLPAKITEVGTSEIKYQRFDFLTGPNYLASKNDIFLIKYANGVTDSIKSLPLPEPATISVSFAENPDRIRLRGNKLTYQGERISDRKLRSMIPNQTSTETQRQLKNEFKKLNQYKINEAALAPVLFLAGAGIHIAALGSVFGGNGGAGSLSGNSLVATFLGGAVLRISGHIVNIVYRNKKKSKRQDIVDIYNGVNN